MSITLQDIESKQDELLALIASFKQQSQTTTLRIPAIEFALQPGERYAGIALNDDGTPSHHVFALPVPDNKMTHAEALAWMDSVGSRPTRSEGALVYANLCQHFKKELHWLGEKFSASRDWVQHFGNGYQGNYYDSNKLLALAVRRLFI